MYSFIEERKHRNNVMKLCMTRVSQQRWMAVLLANRTSRLASRDLYLCNAIILHSNLALVAKQTSVQFLKRTPTFRRGTHMCVRTVLVRVAVLGV